METECDVQYSFLYQICQKVNNWASSTLPTLYSSNTLPPNLNISKHNSKTFQFCQTFLTWEKQRRQTIESLQQLLKSLQRFQTICNRTNIFIKELNVNSRQLRTPQTSLPVDVLASVATLVTDAASGLTSVAQAYNVDGYLDTYRSIMEKDIEATKPLYQSRSDCLAQYQDIEEVPRNVQSNSLLSTVDDVTKSLKLDEFMCDMSTATEAANVYSSIDKLFRKNLGDEEVMDKVSTLCKSYVHRNPAFLQALESVGKTIVDALSIGTQKTAQNANHFAICREIEEIDRLRSIVSSQSVEQNLELDVSNSIDYLERELREVRESFKAICAKENYVF